MEPQGVSTGRSNFDILMCICMQDSQLRWCDLYTAHNACQCQGMASSMSAQLTGQLGAKVSREQLAKNSDSCHWGGGCQRKPRHVCTRSTVCIHGQRGTKRCPCLHRQGGSQTGQTNVAAHLSQPYCPCPIRMRSCGGAQWSPIARRRLQLCTPKKSSELARAHF